LFLRRTEVPASLATMCTPGSVASLSRISPEPTFCRQLSQELRAANAAREGARTTERDHVDLLGVQLAQKRGAGPCASAPATISTDEFWWWLGYQRDGDFTPTTPWLVWIQRAMGACQGEINSGEPGPCQSFCGSGGQPLDDAWHVYRIERDAGETRFYRDGVAAYVQPQGNAVALAPLVRNYALTSDVELDWLRGRTLVSPPPTVTLGPEASD
jgi:hypothetical protein